MNVDGVPSGTNAYQEKSKPSLQVWNGRAQWYSHCGKVKILELGLTDLVPLVGMYLVDI